MKTITATKKKSEQKEKQKNINMYIIMYISQSAQKKIALKKNVHTIQYEKKRNLLPVLSLVLYFPWESEMLLFLADD